MDPSHRIFVFSFFGGLFMAVPAAVELAIELATDDIGAVQAQFVTALSSRNPDALWLLADSTNDILYENRVKGSTLTAIDRNVTAVHLGMTFADWFRLHNDYFSNDAGLAGVTTFKQALELVLRWRVSGYFNDVARDAGQAVGAQYVFPHSEFHLGTLVLTGAGTGVFTKGLGPIDGTVWGPGILAVEVGTQALAADVTLAITGVLPDATTVTVPVTIPSGSAIGTVVPCGGQAVAAGHPAATDQGVVSIGSTALFKAGMLVLVREDRTGTTPHLYVTEVAEVASVAAGVSVTLRQPTPVVSGAFGSQVAPYAAGLRNNYTTAAKVYPLFSDVSGVTNSAGTSGDSVAVHFYPDRPQGFVTF